MKLNIEQTMVYYQDSTSASVSSGSYSSASENNLSFVLRNGIMLLDVLPVVKSKEEYAVIKNIDRERIKKAYPKLSVAKTPAMANDTDIH